MYLILIIPNYVPIDKLASALGIRMVSNGVMVLCFGPLVGKFIGVQRFTLMSIAKLVSLFSLQDGFVILAEILR